MIFRITPTATPIHIMQLTSSFKVIRLISLAAASIALAACASLSGGPASTVVSAPPPDLAARASARALERWTAISAGDYEKAFAYFTPASRNGYSAGDLERQWAQFQAKSPRIGEAACEAEVCTIVVYLDAMVRLPRVGLKQHLLPSTERWTWDGSNFFLIRK